MILTCTMSLNRFIRKNIFYNLLTPTKTRMIMCTKWPWVPAFLPQRRECADCLSGCPPATTYPPRDRVALPTRRHAAARHDALLSRSPPRASLSPCVSSFAARTSRQKLAVGAALPPQKACLRAELQLKSCCCCWQVSGLVCKFF